MRPSQQSTAAAVPPNQELAVIGTLTCAVGLAAFGTPTRLQGGSQLIGLCRNATPEAGRLTQSG